MPLMLTGLFLLVIIVNAFVRNFYYSQTQEDLRDRANLIGFWIESNLLSDSLQVFVKESGRKSNMRVTIVDSAGIVLGDSHEKPTDMDNHGNRPEIIDALRKGEGTSIRYSSTLGENLMYHSIVVQLSLIHI